MNDKNCPKFVKVNELLFSLFNKKKIINVIQI